MNLCKIEIEIPLPRKWSDAETDAALKTIYELELLETIANRVNDWLKTFDSTRGLKCKFPHFSDI